MPSIFRSKFTHWLPVHNQHSLMFAWPSHQLSWYRATVGWMVSLLYPNRWIETSLYPFPWITWTRQTTQKHQKCHGNGGTDPLWNIENAIIFAQKSFLGFRIEVMTYPLHWRPCSTHDYCWKVASVVGGRDDCEGEIPMLAEYQHSAKWKLEEFLRPLIVQGKSHATKFYRDRWFYKKTQSKRYSS